MQDVGLHHVNPALVSSADCLSLDWLTTNRLRLFPKDSILIPKSGASVNLNHRAKLAIDAHVVSHLAVVIPDKSRVDPDYLFWWSVRYDPRTQAQVTSLPSLKLSILKEARVPLPPLHEQHRIVGILNRASHIERLRARATDRLQQFIPALFLKMFGDPAANPMGWNKVPFGDVVTDTTRKVTKVQKRDYASTGKIPIVDQGADLIAGYANDKNGYYDRELPTIIFGDHTRRFKLIRFPFFLGADGAKVLLPSCNYLDPIFLYGQFECLELEDAGYSRHFKFLKSKELILPPIEQQKRFGTLLESATEIADSMGEATNTATALSASLMDRLLGR